MVATYAHIKKAMGDRVKSLVGRTIAVNSISFLDILRISSGSKSSLPVCARSLLALRCKRTGVYDSGMKAVMSAVTNPLAMSKIQ